MNIGTSFSVLNVSAPAAAKRLLGCELERVLPDGQILRVRIVETEAYDEDDPGSHTYRGRTLRNSIMFGPAGFLYVYFIYGMYHCCNIVTGTDGHGEAVLIRAVEPIMGESEMIVRRHGLTGINVTNGPSKFCEALAITRDLNGHDLSKQPVKLHIKPKLPDDDIVRTTRIGLRLGTDTPWRFYIKNSSYVSKK